MKTGSNVELARFGDAPALARAAAAEWLQDVGAARAGNASYCVALSGGRIAGRFLSAAAELATLNHAMLSSVHFFWGDERCVPPADPESNFGLAHKLLLRPLGILDTRIHRVRGEDSPEAAAAEAEAEMRCIAPLTGDGQPVPHMTRSKEGIFSLTSLQSSKCALPRQALSG